jgi:hypothetical protein
MNFSRREFVTEEDNGGGAYLRHNGHGDNGMLL